MADQAGDVTNEGWSIEESLDVEWAHALAPAATILVVEAQSQSRQSLINAVNAARHTPGVDVISMSWGFPESANESIYNNIFTTPPGHRGITFLAASGDSGAAGGPEWPSVTPSVVAVGGTTLNVSFSGRYESETAWVDSGGGLSRYEGEPGYQRSVQVTGKRSTPDIAFDADPDTPGLPCTKRSSATTARGKWWAGQAWAHPPGQRSSPSSTRDVLSRAPDPSTAATQTLPILYSLPSSDFNAVPPLDSKTTLAAGMREHVDRAGHPESTAAGGRYG